jgi:glycosidase
VTRLPFPKAQILKIMGFWTQLGVSGFRMDAVPFVIATKGADVKKSRSQFDMLRSFRELLQWRQGDAIILGEANILVQDDLEYFGAAGERLQMMFNFQLNQNLFLCTGKRRHTASGQGVARDRASSLDGTMGRLPAQPRRARPWPPQPASAPARSSMHSRPNATCSSTTVASADVLRRCSAATEHAWNSPTA